MRLADVDSLIKTVEEGKVGGIYNTAIARLAEEIKYDYAESLLDIDNSEVVEVSEDFTIEKVRQAIQKQIPKEVICNKLSDGLNKDLNHCSCGFDVRIFYFNNPASEYYCPRCGQKLKLVWEV